MVLYVFAGCNGCGKTNLIKNFYSQEENKNIEYVCPDNVAREIRNEFEKQNKSLPCEQSIYLIAMDVCKKRRKVLFSEKKDFLIETVLSRIEKINELIEAKRLGYKVVVTYIATDNYQVNINRVAKRVEQGGHNVPTEKIIERYKRSLTNIQHLLLIADEVAIYDNSTEDKAPTLVYSQTFENTVFNNDYASVNWATKYLLPYIDM